MEKGELLIMRILIAGALDSYNHFNEESLCEAIAAYYKKQGHMVDLFYLPFKPDFHGIHEQILAYRLLTIITVCDLLLTVGYPAFALQHANKYSFLFEFLPEFHALLNTNYGYIVQRSDFDKDQRLVNSIHRTESVCLKEAKGIYCASQSLCEDIKTFTSLDAKPFSFFANLPRSVISEECKSAWIVESCLEPADRIDLLLSAFAVRKDVNRLTICVPEADSFHLKALHERIHRLTLSNNVSVVQGAVTMDALEGCIGAVCLRCGSGYVPAYMEYARARGLHCLVMQDGGALREWARESTSVDIVAEGVDEISRCIITQKTKAQPLINQQKQQSQLVNILKRLV